MLTLTETNFTTDTFSLIFELNIFELTFQVPRPKIGISLPLFSFTVGILGVAIFLRKLEKNV